MDAIRHWPGIPYAGALPPSSRVSQEFLDPRRGFLDDHHHTILFGARGSSVNHGDTCLEFFYPPPPF